jgi:hypothetical protein
VSECRRASEAGQNLDRESQGRESQGRENQGREN